MKSFAFLNEDMQHSKICTVLLRAVSNFGSTVGVCISQDIATDRREKVAKTFRDQAHLKQYTWTRPAEDRLQSGSVVGEVDFRRSRIAWLACLYSHGSFNKRAWPRLVMR